MKSNKQITTVKEINKKIEDLQAIQVSLTLLLASAKAASVSLALVFSADCAECGEHKGLIQDGRMEILEAVTHLTELEYEISRMVYLIDPKNTCLNKDYEPYQDE